MNNSKRDPNVAYQPTPTREEVRLRLIEALLTSGGAYMPTSDLYQAVESAERFVFRDENSGEA